MFLQLVVGSDVKTTPGGKGPSTVVQMGSQNSLTQGSKCERTVENPIDHHVGLYRQLGWCLT